MLYKPISNIKHNYWLYMQKKRRIWFVSKW